MCKLGYVKVWVTEAKCVDCGVLYKIDPYLPLRRVCNKCVKKNNKRVRTANHVFLLSILFFPLGIYLYFRWKDKDPYLSKNAKVGFLIPVVPLSILLSIIVLFYLLILFN